MAVLSGGICHLGRLGYRGAMTARPLVRVAVNVAIDGLLAALAVPLARCITDPGTAFLAALAAPTRRRCRAVGRRSIPIVPAILAFRRDRRSARRRRFRTPRRHSVRRRHHADHAGVRQIAFPAIHALTLLLLLGAPRVAYRVAPPSRRQAPFGRQRCHVRRARCRRHRGRGPVPARARAATAGRPSASRACSRPAIAETGRRIHGHAILGAHERRRQPCWNGCSGQTACRAPWWSPPRISPARR